MGRSSENAGFLQLPENAPCNTTPRAFTSAQDLFHDYPLSFLPSFEQPLQSVGRCRECVDEDLHPLQHVNAELKAEQSSLLLKNSELMSQTLLLKLENQRLKQQLELQLQKKQVVASLSVSSYSLEESSNDTDDDDEVKSVLISSDDPYTTDDSS